jgi:hypothetical protein
MGARASLTCTLLRNSGTYGAPVWAEVKNVRNPGVPKSKTMAEVTTRRHGGIKAFIGTLKEFGLEFEMNADDADADYTAFEDSYWNGTLIDLLVLRGPNTAGKKGVRMLMEVETFDEKQDQEKHVETTVKLVIRDPDNATDVVVERYTVPA